MKSFLSPYSYAIVNPNAVKECQIPGKPRDESLGFRVELLGQHITNDMLIQNGHTYIHQNIEKDVGIRDSTKLHIFTLVEHPVVVLFDYKTLI